MPVYSWGPWAYILLSRTHWCGVVTTRRVWLQKPPSLIGKWLTKRTSGVYKRGVTMGIVIGWGNLNGIVSSNIYRGEDKPRFYPGHGTLLAYLVLFLFGGSLVQYLLLRRENQKRIRGDRNNWIEGLDRAQIEALGDQRPDFVYTV